MCYSVYSSLIAFIISFAVGIKMIQMGGDGRAIEKNKYLPLSLLILTYSQVQLAEAFVWYGVDHNKLKWNRFGTTWLQYTLPLHLLMMGVGYLLVSKGTIYVPFLLGMLCFVIVVSRFYSVRHSPYSFPQQNTSRSCSDFGARLIWPFDVNWYVWMAIVAIGCFLYYDKLGWQNKIKVVLLFGVLYAVARWISVTNNTRSTFWCFASAIGAPLFLWCIQ